MILISAAFVGLGSSVFHPGSSRVARMASGGRHGLAQSMFQTGGNIGSALGPLTAAFLVVWGQGSIAWYSLAALLAILVLWNVSGWYRDHGLRRAKSARRSSSHPEHVFRLRQVTLSLAIPLALDLLEIFLPHQHRQLLYFLARSTHPICPFESAQLYLFAFLAAVAAGAFRGRTRG